MGYKVYYDEMWEIIDNIKKLKDDWSDDFEAIRKSVEDLKSSSYIKGAGSDNIKLYMNEIHSNLIDRIEILLSLLYGSVEIYRGGYQADIDGGDGSDYGIRYTTMVEDELEYGGEVSRNIDNLIGLNSSIKWEVNSVRNSISDLVWLGEPTYADLIEGSLNLAKNIASNLNDSILVYEGSQTDSLNSVQTAIEELRNIINYQLGVSRVPMASYAQNSWASMCNYERLQTATESIVNTLNSTDFQDAYDKSIASTFDRQALIDKEEREKKAKAIKWAVTGLCVVASVAATVLTAGAAAPLVLGVVGAATAAVSTGTDILLDEYVEKGNLKEVNWVEFGAKVTISAAVGFATGYASGAIGGSSSAINKTIGKKIGTNLISGYAESGIEFVGDTLYDVGEKVITGKTDEIGESILENLDELGEKVVVDTIGGVIGTAADELVDIGGKKIFKNVKDGLKKDIGKAAYKTIGESMIGTVDNGLSAIVKEARDSKINNEDFSFEDVGKSVKEDFINDVVTGGMNNAADVYIDNNLANKKFENTMKNEAGYDKKLDVVEFENGTTVLKKDYDAAIKATSQKGYEGKSARELLGVKTMEGATEKVVDLNKSDIKKARYQGKSETTKIKVTDKKDTK